MNLLQSLYELHPEQLVVMSHIRERLRMVHFVGKVLNYFMRPFIKVEMSLSEQLQSLSTYSHLVTALWTWHKLSFLTGALFSDSQAIIKNIFFTIAELQLENPDYLYYILFEGTDRLEGVFSHVRTQDHARNFDILQLAHKLCIATEINAIFERYPELNHGHVQRDLVNACGVDHINPKSWVGDVTVGKVDIKHEYMAGRDDANKLLQEYLGAQIDFDKLFNRDKNPNIDHLRPGGDYIGCRPIDETEEENDMRTRVLPTDNNLNDLQDLRASINASEHANTDYVPDELNPSENIEDLHYLLIDGKKEINLIWLHKCFAGLIVLAKLHQDHFVHRAYQKKSHYVNLKIK